MLTHVSLFSGIGGIDIAAEWAGFKTICLVEIDPFCQKVLRKHWPDAPVIGDIRDVTKETLADATSQRCQRRADTQQARSESEQERHVWSESCGQGEVGRQRGGSTNPPITLVTGGFPCQPVSVAGQRRGKEDDRWLWPEMLRVIQEVRPTWVLAENVAGLIHMGIEDCLSGLESASYEVATYQIPACALNAPHRRDRIFIVGYSKELHKHGGNGESAQSDGQLPKSRNTDSQDNVSDADERSAVKGEPQPSQRQVSGGHVSASVADAQEDSSGYGDNGNGSAFRDGEEEGKTRGAMQPSEWWAVEPDVGRVAHGIPARVDRLRALGNAVVPQQIYPILKVIADIETGQR